MENRSEIVDIMQILEDSLTAEGIDQWLRASNRLLDGRRPIDLIDEGDTESVGRAARPSWMAPTSDPSPRSRLHQPEAAA
jgi:hypothetical protein